MFHYAVHIVWSEEDSAYLASIPELAGCVADGASPEEAMKNAYAMADDWVFTARELGRPVPPPLTLQEHERNKALIRQNHDAWLTNVIEKRVRESYGRLIKRLNASFSKPHGSIDERPDVAYRFSGVQGERATHRSDGTISERSSDGTYASKARKIRAADKAGSRQ